MSSAAATAPSGAPVQSLRRVLPWYLLILFVTVVLLVVILLFSKVRGQEFHPATWERREYQLWRIPLLDWQVTPTYRFPAESSRLGTYLRSHHWLSTPGGDMGTNDTPPWDVMREESLYGVRTTDAWLLWELLEEESVWIEWSQTHAERAAELWPVVVAHVRRQEYTSLPRLLGMALDNPPAAEWTERLSMWRSEQRP